MFFGMEELTKAQGMGTEATGEAGARPRVLFVDDEANVLAGLKLLLRDQRKDWDMAFAASAPEALTFCEQAPFDVVLTDMRMPRMDGAALLEEIKNRWPRTVRIVLSGQTEPASIMRTVFLAHQFVAKPASSQGIRVLVSRMLAHHHRVQAPAIASALGGIGCLPPAPTSLIALTAAMGRPNSSIADIANIIQKDPSLCAKLLQLVNSSFFGLARRVSTAGEAVSLLGLTNIRSITLAVEAMKAFESKSRTKQRQLEEVRRHCEVTAAIAAGIAKTVGLSAQEAYTLGILHDVGHVIAMSMDLPETLAITPALAGAYLLSVWGLPLAIGEAVAHHHDPAAVEHLGLELLDVIHAANHIASQYAPNPMDPTPSIDLAYLQTHGVTAEKFADWKALAQEAVGSGKVA